MLHIYFSRNGLAETEIVQLVKIPALTWVSMFEEFLERMFFTCFNGFLSYANRQVGHCLLNVLALVQMIASVLKDVEPYMHVVWLQIR